MARDVVEGVGTIFFNPGQRDTLTLVKSSGEVVYHGRLSPALTGRLALLIFLPLCSLEKARSTVVGSMSISSTSDMFVEYNRRGRVESNKETRQSSTR